MPPPDDLKFRPIVGGPSSRTNHLSQLLDVLLRPYIELVQSNLKDDFDVIRKIDAEWRMMVRQSPSSYQFFTWDVLSVHIIFTGGKDNQVLDPETS